MRPTSDSLETGGPLLHAHSELFAQDRASHHFLNWQQDPYGNFLGRVVVLQPTEKFTVTVDLTAEMTVINPFDFFLEPDAEFYPFAYSLDTLKDLMPFLHVTPVMEGRCG